MSSGRHNVNDLKGDLDMPSRLRHETWMKTLHCPVLWLEGDMTVEERVSSVMDVTGDF